MRTKKIIAVLVAVVLVMGMIAGCSSKPAETEQPQEEKDPIKVGIVLSVGGKGDKSFNDAAIAGLEKAKEELGITYKEIEPKEMASDEEALTFLAKENYDLVIGVGFLMEDALAKVAERFPDTKFAIIDAVVDKPNVASLVFKEHEGSFLVGAVAGLLTETNNVGFVGGMDIPLIHRFEVGYVEGVKYVNPDCEVQISYTGADPSAFNNPGRGKELTLAQMNAGADIVYHAAGGTGQGVIEAAKEMNKYAIGVDSDQCWMAEGTVIASMLKRVDVAVFETVKAVVENRYRSGTVVFGVAENGVGVCEHIPDEIKDDIEEIKEKIISGEIKVTDYMAQNN